MKTSKYYDRALLEAKSSGADLRKTWQLLSRAYKYGDHRAAYALGTWYLHGKGTLVPPNLTKAVQLLREAADGDNAEASFDLAVCYEKGTGVKKSKKKAAQLYLKAALLDDKQAHYEIGRCYWYGFGVKMDRSIANIWLDRAAKFQIRK